MKGQHRKLPTAYSPSEYFQLALGAKTRTALALLVLLTTGVVAMGWFLKNEQLVQIWHWFAPMQLNTALCLGLLSASALLRQRETPAKWNIILAAAATLIAVLSGMEFVVGKDLGIDRLLIEPFITTNPDTPGRMSPTSALTLILISAASVVLTLKRHEQPMLLSATLNAFAALVAGSTLIAYLNGLENARAGRDSPTPLLIPHSVLSSWRLSDFSMPPTAFARWALTSSSGRTL